MYAHWVGLIGLVHTLRVDMCLYYKYVIVLIKIILYIFTCFLCTFIIISVNSADFKSLFGFKISFNNCSIINNT